MTDIYIFDRKSVNQHHKRAKAQIEKHDFLFREIADRLGDRLMDIARDFPKALDLGSNHHILKETLGSRGGIQDFTTAKFCPEEYPKLSESKSSAKDTESSKAIEIIAEIIPVASRSYDLIISNLCLHWVNDLPGILLQAHQCLKADGLFMASMIGGETLKELRACLMEAEMDIQGGVSPRVSPLIDVKDAGALLQRAGFALPVSDFDRLEVSYANAFDLMKELRGMGETNAIHNRTKAFTRKETLLRAAQLYQEKFSDSEGRINATFDIVYLAGWAPHTSQQKPLRPGSAVERLSDFLNTEETKLT
ncbi:SAM-dependent methyltransferase [Kiloniella spongiae]|uniref:SAM-dependent methyltransferase n=1 Tax=Kiloniella spongiae TaxID=1489064 RepID=A0A0H2MAD3_9PROT|nr:methyltransferase domain-containing protein [Kiloniella spongiae]KLN59464.1 SAM-dependent methyltransferase [Kiloniella spongiae]